jgi:predicted glutamine amidotransferase
MCKLFILTNTAKLKPVQLSKLLKASAQIMGKTDSHGFGWAMLNGNKVVGERCLDPEYFENRFFSNGTVPTMFKPVFEAWEANSFGKLPTQGFSGGLLVHARISTNRIGLENTHPFINDSYALIHNGIVDNIGADYEQKSTCDTEHLLHHLTSSNVQGMVESVTGYYAIGALNRVTGELLVIKDDEANLNACYVPSLESMAFGTNADQLHAVLKAADLAHTRIKKVADNVALTFDRKGTLTSHFEIKPVKRAANTYDTKSYYASMGWDYNDSFEGSYDRLRSSSNVVPMHTSEPSIPKDIQRLRDIEDGIIPDGAPNVRDFVPEFADDNGQPLPNYMIDKLYIIVDADGNEISADKFNMLDDLEQSFCEIIDRQTGESTARYAG